MKLLWPVKSPWNPPYISQKFGENPQNYPGWAGHMGIDFPNPDGAADYCTHDGVVVEVQQSDSPNSYGYDVIYQFDEDGITWQVLHGHHQANEVTVGQQVKAGQEIGKVGHTGKIIPSPGSTGSHVHLGLRQLKNGQIQNYNNGFYGWLDPLPYLLAKGDSMTLINNDGTYYVEGEHGHFGIAKVEFLNLLLKITSKVENRVPNGPQLGVIESFDGFVIKEN